MASLRVEIYDPPGIATFERRIAGIQGVSNLSGTVYRRQLGQGQFTLPADYPRLGEVVDVDPANHANDVASLARVYRGTSLIQEFLIDGTPNVISETPTQIAGPTVEAVMDWAIVEAWDWDGSDDFTSRFPDWIYGGRNVLVDPTTATCTPTEIVVWSVGMASWNVSVDGQSTGTTIPWNATATQVEVAIEALSTVTDVLVTGSGIEADPWQIVFVEPCVPDTVIVNGTTLSPPPFITAGTILPTGWTKSTTVGFGVPIEFGSYTTFELDTPPTPPPCGGDAIHIVGGTPSLNSFPGAQTTPRVESGGLYQASVWVYSTTTAPFRLVIRPVTEEPIIDFSAWPSSTVTANTWTELPITDLMIPEGVDRVIFRVAHVGTANIDFWVACPELNEGLAATTIGEITNDLLADAQTDHSPTRTTLDFINPSFTNTLDSAGAAWDNSEVSISIPRGMTYRKVLESMFGPLGYEWNLTPTVGTPGEWDLNLWNPDGRVTDVTSLDTPSLLVGQGTLNGYATKRVPRANIVTAEGEGGYSSRSRNTASFPVIGRREGYAYDAGYIGTLVEGWADTLLAKFLTEGLAPRFDVADPNTDEHPIPIVNYGLAYRLNVDLADGDGKISRDIEAISWRDSDEGLVWTIHTGQAQFDQPLIGGGSFGSPGLLRGGGGGVSLGVLGPTVEGTRWLLDNFRRQQLVPKASALAPIGGGGDPSVLVAASDASALEKAKADFECVGGNDEITIMQAQATLAPDGGRIVLTSGTFTVNPDGIVLDDDVHLHGMGRRVTNIHKRSGVGDAVSAGSRSYVSGIQFTNAGVSTGAVAVDLSGAGQSVVEDCEFNDYGISVEASDAIATIRGCYQPTGGTFVSISSEVDRVTIVNNAAAGVLDLGAAYNVLVADNQLQGGIRSTAARAVSIVGNTWIGLSNPADNACISLTGASSVVSTPGVVVAGNYIHPFGDSGIVADSVVGLSVVGNTFDDATNVLTDCTESQFVGNMLLNSIGHGVALIGSSRCIVSSNSFMYPLGSGSNADCVHLAGDSNFNLVTANTMEGHSSFPPRHAVNVSAAACDCNMVVGNSFGDPADYVSGPLSDSGTDTQLTWPNDPTYGDNFVDCGTAS